MIPLFHNSIIPFFHYPIFPLFHHSNIPILSIGVLMTAGKYDQIYEVIRQIPAGKVATYGQIARMVGECTPRMVGYALAALKPGSDVPWQRIINSQGKISLRNDGGESVEQRLLLESEGVYFNNKGIVDLEKFGY